MKDTMDEKDETGGSSFGERMKSLRKKGRKKGRGKGMRRKR